MTKVPPKVFISYSHDTVAHQARVLDLADRLRADGIDAEIDQYNDSPSEGWPLWCARQIEAADIVLMVCTETYHRRVGGEEKPGTGRGVVWEAAIIRQLLYDAGAISDKFVPVLFSDASPEQIPMQIKGWTWYAVDTEEGYEGLYRRLTGQPHLPRPALGTIRTLLARKRQWSEGTREAASSPALAPPPARDHDAGAREEEPDVEFARTWTARLQWAFFWKTGPASFIRPDDVSLLQLGQRIKWLNEDTKRRWGKIVGDPRYLYDNAPGNT